MYLTTKGFIALYLCVSLVLLQLPALGRFLYTGGAPEQDIIFWVHYPSMAGGVMVVVPLTLVAAPFLAMGLVILYLLGYGFEEGKIIKA